MAANDQEIQLRKLSGSERHVWLLGLDSEQLIATVPYVFVLILMVFFGGGSGLFFGLISAMVWAYVMYGRYHGELVFYWLPHTLRFYYDRFMGRNVWKNPAASFGTWWRSGKRKPFVVPLPPSIGKLSVLAHRRANNGGEMGVVVDNTFGTYTASITGDFTSFVVQTFNRQDDLLSAWSQMLSDRAKELSPITRIAWVVRTIPQDAFGHTFYLENTAKPEFWDSKEGEGYRSTLNNVNMTTVDYEITVNVTISRSRAARWVKQYGGGQLGYCRILERELDTLGRQMRQTLNVERIGVVSHDRLIDDIRLAYEPFDRERILKLGRERDPNQQRLGIEAWPGSMTNKAKYARTNTAFHRVWWIKDYPSQPLRPDYAYRFLADSLAPKAYVMVLEPVPARFASRHIAITAVNDESEIENRQKTGRRVGAARRRQLEDVEARDIDLAEGYAYIRYSMYVWTAGPTLEALDQRSAEIEQLLTDAQLDFDPETHRHAPSLSYFVPTGHGLKVFHAWRP